MVKYGNEIFKQQCADDIEIKFESIDFKENITCEPEIHVGDYGNLATINFDTVEVEQNTTNDQLRTRVKHNARKPPKYSRNPKRLPKTKVDSTINKFACEYCDYTSRHQSGLTYHWAKHSALRPFKCEICSYRGPSKSSLRRHLDKMHRDAELNRCEICGYLTSGKTELKHHMLLHVDEKPYLCDLCDYRTGLKAYLQKHKMKHTKNQPFICRLCDFKSASRKLFKTHVKMQKHYEQYACDRCDYKSTYKMHLTKHKMTHTRMDEANRLAMLNCNEDEPVEQSPQIGPKKRRSGLLRHILESGPSVRNTLKRSAARNKKTQPNKTSKTTDESDTVKNMLPNSVAEAEEIVEVSDPPKEKSLRCIEAVEEEIEQCIERDESDTVKNSSVEEAAEIDNVCETIVLSVSEKNTLNRSETLKNNVGVGIVTVESVLEHSEVENFVDPMEKSLHRSEAVEELMEQSIEREIVAESDSEKKSSVEEVTEIGNVCETIAQCDSEKNTLDRSETPNKVDEIITVESVLEKSCKTENEGMEEVNQNREIVAVLVDPMEKSLHRAEAVEELMEQSIEREIVAESDTEKKSLVEEATEIGNVCETIAQCDSEKNTLDRSETLNKVGGMVAVESILEKRSEAKNEVIEELLNQNREIVAELDSEAVDVEVEPNQNNERDSSETTVAPLVAFDGKASETVAGIDFVANDLALPDTSGQSMNSGGRNDEEQNPVKDILSHTDSLEVVRGSEILEYNESTAPVQVGLPSLDAIKVKNVQNDEEKRAEEPLTLIKNGSEQKILKESHQGSEVVFETEKRSLSHPVEEGFTDAMEIETPVGHNVQFTPMDIEKMQGKSASVLKADAVEQLLNSRLSPMVVEQPDDGLMDCNNDTDKPSPSDHMEIENDEEISKCSNIQQPVG